jgi:hypothetical protein
VPRCCILPLPSMSQVISSRVPDPFRIAATTRVALRAHTATADTSPAGPLPRRVSLPRPSTSQATNSRLPKPFLVTEMTRLLATAQICNCGYESPMLSLLCERLPLSSRSHTVIWRLPELIRCAVTSLESASEVIATGDRSCQGSPATSL